MLLIEKASIDRSTLVETARRYDIVAAIDVIYRALEGDCDTADETTLGLPSGLEYAALKEQYEVA
jgi:hypothetical protein